MALGEYFESEVAVAIAATAAVLTPMGRRLLRRGAVFGLTGVLVAGDALAAFAGGVTRGLQQAAAAGTGEPPPDEAVRGTG